MRIRNAAGIAPLILFATIIFASSTLSAARPNGNTKNVVSSRTTIRDPEIKDADSPGLVQRRGNNFNSVKRTKKNPAPPYPRSGPLARESPMIQAFGMPKKALESSDEIERVTLDRISALDGKVDKVNFGTNEAGIRAYGMPKRNFEDNGFIEKKQETLHHEPKSHLRRSRATEPGSQNDLEDLDAQENKVFRPLFVYRKQIADRYRINRKQKPIYGAYQYGRNRPSNFGHGYN